MSSHAQIQPAEDQRAASRAGYAAGLVQGIALVTFPAASTIFTATGSYGLSSSQYGAMFLPQAVTAVTASLLEGGLARRFGAKRVYLAGLAANLAAMLLLIASRFVMTDQGAAYPLLLAATAFLGVGFGLTVPSINTFTAAFHPDAVDRSVLVLNSLLGLGTALAPVFVAVFVGLGFWVGLPILAAAAVAALFAVSLRLPLRTVPTAAPAAAGRGPQPAGRDQRAPIPAQFWLFAGFAVLYGFCETMNGNWSQLDLTSLKVSATVASLALTVFWAMVTLGRVLFAVIQSWFPSRLAYHILPFVLAGAFVAISALPSHAGAAGILAFALAGFGCSALLPLTISFGQEKLVSMSGAVAGLVIACYQCGYGIAAFGVGPLRHAGLSLPSLYAASAVVATALGGLSFAVAHRRPSPASVHPRPVLAPQPRRDQLGVSGTSPVL
ncbi:MAG TPA: MFS transporter [Streptosporangiaceae bacterium]|nr:MFS transporter [Streptosporangiaceae bacterium]